MILQILSLFCVLRFLMPVLGKEGVNFRSWNSESNSSLFQSESLYDSTVGEYATIVSFGYISKANFPEWVYHNFMAGYDNDLSELMSLPCSVEILAIESISNRLGIQKNGGILHVAGHPDQVFSCLHPQTHTHARYPTQNLKTLSWAMPILCIPDVSRSTVDYSQTCEDLRTQDMRLSVTIFSNGAKPDVNVTASFTTSMGTFPVHTRPSFAGDIVAHVTMLYPKPHNFNKVVLHMWLSYLLLVGARIVSIAYPIVYDELPRFVATHPNIVHYDTSFLNSIGQGCPDAKCLRYPYPYEFHKMMLATFVRFEYRVMYGAQYVYNIDPDEFPMAPHGPGFDKYQLSPFTRKSEVAARCNASIPESRGDRALEANSKLVKMYEASLLRSTSTTPAAPPSPIPPPALPPATHTRTHFVPLNLTDRMWSDVCTEGILEQGDFMKWVLSSVFAKAMQQPGFRGKGMEVTMHKQYMSTKNTTEECLMKNLRETGKFSLAPCFDYLSVMHPGTNKGGMGMRSKYLNIKQPCMRDNIHYSCWPNLKREYSSSGCVCTVKANQPYIFLMHLRANSKSGGHSVQHIQCSVADHESVIRNSIPV